MNLVDFLWTLLVIFFMVMYFMILFQVVVDLFRNDQMSGWIKALWIILLILIPFLSLLVYVIVYHKGMAERQMKEVKQYQAAQDAYIKSVAGSGKSATEQIADAQQLLSSGAITQAEFDQLKAKALAG